MAVNNSNEMTREGYNALNEELEHLITVVRKENAERLKEAISLGDISENAEYDSAKDAQAETEERINQIEEILRTAVIVGESPDNESDDTVQTGRTVKVKDMKLNETMTYKIVGTTEADPLNGKISNESPVGKGLLGHKLGQRVKIEAPMGVVVYKVLSINK